VFQFSQGSLPDNFVFALRGGNLVLGWGGAESLGAEAVIPENLKEYAAGDNRAKLIVSPKIFEAAMNMLESLDGPYDEMPLFTRQVYSILATFGDSFRLFTAGMDSSGKKSGKLIMAEGVSPAEVIARLSGAVSDAEPAPEGPAAAEEIVSDLRNAKAASLMFYADNAKWPESGDAVSMDQYVHRPFLASGGRYEKVIIGPEYKDKEGKTRTNIGFMFKSDGSVTGRVRQRLARIAENSGLLSREDSLEPYDADSMTIFINMK
jgi:hypothetical protein